MNVLFVYRGYGESMSNSVIDFQRDSLIKIGVEVGSFPFGKGGVKGYFSATRQLKHFLHNNPCDIIHAHYSFSGFISRLATRKPVICSLMGSDILQFGKLLGLITWFFYRFMWNSTIVKSKEMKKHCPASLLIPNGIDLSNFRPIPMGEAKEKSGFNLSPINIIFVAEDPSSAVKNLSLARDATRLMKNEKAKLHIISGKTFDELPYIYNSADVLLLTSLSEGSPNVVKEAMACNCSIVATDVGDIREVIGDTEGCFITSFDPHDVAAKLKMALAFGRRTNGRDKIQHFDNKLIAAKIVEVYKSVMDSKK